MRFSNISLGIVFKVVLGVLSLLGLGSVDSASWLKQYERTCGYSPQHSRYIWQETQVERYEYPWIVSLQYRWGGQPGLHACTGVILTDRWILTSASCYDESNIPMNQRGVVVGLLSLQEKGMGTYGIEKVIAHEMHSQFYNDILLIRTDRSIATVRTTSRKVNAICLPTWPSTPPDRAIAINWSDHKAKRRGTMELLEEPVFLVDHAQCTKEYARKGVRVPNNSLCYGSWQKQPLLGHSSIVVQIINEKAYLVGMYGFSTDDTRHAIFTDVSKYRHWIESKF